MACDKSIRKHRERTARFWFVTCKLNNRRLSIYEIGFHTVAKDLNLFLENTNEDKDVKLRDKEDLHEEIRS